MRYHCEPFLSHLHFSGRVTKETRTQVWFSTLSYSWTNSSKFCAHSTLVTDMLRRWACKTTMKSLLPPLYQGHYSCTRLWNNLDIATTCLKRPSLMATTPPTATTISISQYRNILISQHLISQYLVTPVHSRLVSDSSQLQNYFGLLHICIHTWYLQSLSTKFL